MVAEHGSTAAAARHLEVTQSTISRHLAELEQQLSVQLFDRKKTGLTLTDKGQELLSFAQQMDSVAHNMQAQAAHFSSTVSGTVRISASEVIATNVLPYCIANIVNDNPELDIEIVASNDASNLLSREADIAIRMFQPQQQDLIAQHLLDVDVSFYASKNYLQQYGVPDSPESFMQHRFIGFDLNTLFIDGARQLGFKLKREHFYIRSDAIGVQDNCVIAGLGIAVMQNRIARDITSLEKVNLGFDIPSMPLYLVAQKELRVSRKIRTVFDGLKSGLSSFYNAGA